jgi:hypothetical protein
MFKIKEHPGLCERNYRQAGSSGEKEVNVLQFYKYRLDQPTWRVLQLSVNVQSTIQTLK